MAKILGIGLDKEGGNVLEVIGIALHHCDWTKFGPNSTRHRACRLRGALLAINGKVCQIKQALMDGRPHSEILRLFEEQIEFGNED